MVERRKFKRYPMPRGTLAILRSALIRLRHHDKMDIGEIAMVLYKSAPAVIGQVTDMSFGGIGITSELTAVPEGDSIELDLLMTEQGLYLHNIPYVAVPVQHAETPMGQEAAPRTHALRFSALNQKQKGQVRKLLSFHIG